MQACSSEGSWWDACEGREEREDVSRLEEMRFMRAVVRLWVDISRMLFYV